MAIPSRVLTPRQMMQRGVILLLVLTGCATSSTIQDPAVRRAVSAVQIIDPGEQAPREFTIIKEVVSYSCARQLGSTPTMDEAKESLRVEAGKLKADAVVSVACQPVGVSWKKNCWKAIECRGDAVKWQ